MPKRKAEDFFKCIGIPGVSDEAIRKVIKRFTNEPAWQSTSCKSFEKRFPHLDNFLLQDEDTKIYTLNLQSYMDKLTQECPTVVSFCSRTLGASMQNGTGIAGCLYCDEAVPGNVIAPDNRRRSWCFYFTWTPWIPSRKERLWIPVSVIRNDIIDKLPGGLPRAFSVVFRALVPFFQNLVIGSNLVVTEKIWFLGDEACIKAVLSHKGSSGIRPCVRCDNCMGKQRGVDGYPGIETHDFSQFTSATADNVKETFLYLRSLREQGATKKAIDEAEQLSGWKWNEYVFIMDPQLHEFLQIDKTVYDAMHCLWCNGIVNFEIGLFVQRAVLTAEVERVDLENFLSGGWKPSMQFGNYPGISLKNLVSSKLLRFDGSDFRGDASQTLQLMCLLTFFAIEVLSGIEELAAEIECLTLLCRVCCIILNAKVHPHQISGLTDLQCQHQNHFKRCYGEDRIRPKHHYRFHIDQQVDDAGVLMDTWPTERKHRVFKSDLAPRCKKLKDFEKSILLRWWELDLQALTEMNLDAGLQQAFKTGNDKKLKFGRTLQSDIGTCFRVGNVLLFAEGNAHIAYKVASCFATNSTLGLIVQNLHLKSADPHFLWSKWQLIEEYTVLPLEEAVKSLRTTFYSVSADGTSMILLR